MKILMVAKAWVKRAREKILGYDKSPLLPFREYPRCPRCGKVYNHPTTAKMWGHSRSSFFGVCSHARREHIHYHCERCGKEWITECAPPAPKVRKIVKEEVKEQASIKEEKYCRTCENDGVVEHGGKMYKCPDCWRGDVEKEFWDNGIPTLQPSQPTSLTPTPASLTPIIAGASKQ
jgi:predicted RNA-binding Zn-ribbon protein involved in translation (DUF1610 family)